MDDIDIDPELAAQMGFSSFGGPSKKRKHNADEAVTDAPSNAQSATGSNSQPVGQPPARATSQPLNQPSARPAAPASSSQDLTTSAANGSTDIRAFARGVRNERGDMAYFLPSFLEDPWESLRDKGV